MKIAESIKERILIPFRLLPKEGLAPEKVAFSLTIGIISGLFPVIGLTTVISIVLTLLFRQNLLIVQSVQWLLALVQVFLIIPFMRLGAFLLNHDVVHITIKQINHAFQPGVVSGLKTVGMFHLYGVFSWIILAIPAGIIFYYSFLAVFQKRIRSQEILIQTGIDNMKA